MMFARGFSLLELIVVVAIISTLVAVALQRLLPYIDEAERVSVLRVEGQLRSTLMMEAAERIVRGQAGSITELEGSNPFNLLAEPPKNYLGELASAGQGPVTPRHWYFRPHDGQLVYRLGEPYSLHVDDAPGEDPAFEVRVVFADNNANGAFDVERDDLHGVRLERVAGLTWLGGANAQ